MVLLRLKRLQLTKKSDKRRFGLHSDFSDRGY